MRSSSFISFLLFFFFSLFALVSSLPEPVNEGARELIARGGWDDGCDKKQGWGKCDDGHCCHEKETCCGKACCAYGEYCVQYEWDWKCCKDKDCKKW
ncbi:unnamed protein product [Rhizoctonia solani]|uniref:Granulins domain-containing protein n=1 Tax=Rhizoctonia solani TaxID=456999 RepID=A0A8H3BRN3_9AGAM|nr:unnamed protein product [Rhizoctonia solani]